MLPLYVRVKVTEVVVAYDAPSFIEIEPVGGLFSCQFQLMLESCVMVKVMLVPVPLDGIDPVPVQPVLIQTVPLSVTGLTTLRVRYVPES